MKFIRRFLIFLVLVLVGLGLLFMSFINSIRYQVTSDDLPQDVYETSGDLLDYAKTKMVDLILADEEDQYTIVEEILNLIILDSIQKNMNTSYDPLGDCEEDACLYIFKNSPFFVNYAYAYLNDVDQMVVVVSGGSDKYISVDTSIFLVFDIDIDIANLSINFTLDTYSFGERAMSMKMLDFTMNRLDKANIEDNMTFGELDLDEYTYMISLSDLDLPII